VYFPDDAAAASRRAYPVLQLCSKSCMTSSFFQGRRKERSYRCFAQRISCFRALLEQLRDGQLLPEPQIGDVPLQLFSRKLRACSSSLPSGDHQQEGGGGGGGRKTNFWGVWRRGLVEIFFFFLVGVLS